MEVTAEFLFLRPNDSHELQTIIHNFVPFLAVRRFNKSKRFAAHAVITQEKTLMDERLILICYS